MQPRVLLFGGVGPDAGRPDVGSTFVWRDGQWDVGWRLSAPLEPPGRGGLAMAEVPPDHLFLFGGSDEVGRDCAGQGETECSDAWLFGAFRGANCWFDRRCTPTRRGPSRAGGARAAWDPTQGKVVLFGGFNGDGDCDHAGNAFCAPTWTIEDIWDAHEWTRYEPEDTPSPRAWHALAPAGVSDEAGETCDHDGVFLFGGRREEERFDDLWKWDGGTRSWVPRCAEACDPKPAPRSGAALACDVADDALVLFGGEVGGDGDCGTGSRFCDDTWLYTAAGGWERVEVADPEGDGGPAPRTRHTQVWDTARRVVVLFGGESETAEPEQACGDGSVSDAAGHCAFADVWEWTSSSWQRVRARQTSEGGPGRRWAHGMAHLSRLGESVMWGGDTVRPPEHQMWFWQGGMARRPRHAFEVRFDAADAEEAGIVDLTIAWDAGAEGDSGECVAGPGAQLQVARGGAWTAVASGHASSAEPETMTWRAGDDSGWTGPAGALERVLLHGAERRILAAVVPGGDSGCTRGRARVATDYVEARVRYLLP